MREVHTSAHGILQLDLGTEGIGFALLLVLQGSRCTLRQGCASDRLLEVKTISTPKPKAHQEAS